MVNERFKFKDEEFEIETIKDSDDLRCIGWINVEQDNFDELQQHRLTSRILQYVHICHVEPGYASYPVGVSWDGHYWVIV
jgi:hypothetical protein